MTLYVPGPVLRAGDNEVVLLEVERPAREEAGACVAKGWWLVGSDCLPAGEQWLFHPGFGSAPSMRMLTPVPVPVLLPYYRSLQ